MQSAARSYVDARRRYAVLGLQRTPCANAVVRMRWGGIDVDREDASAPPHRDSDQRVRVPAEVASHDLLIARGVVDAMPVERLFLTDGAHWKDRNAMPSKRQGGVEG